MKRILAALPLLLVTAAHAGSSGAGPAASAGPGVGAIVMPGSHAALGTPPKDDYTDRILPGNGAVVTLGGEQLQRTATALRGFNGAEEEGSMVRAPTVLSDGTAAVIALDLRTGRLSITRQE